MFLISNFCRMRSLSSESARISSRIAASPPASSGSAAANLSAASGAAVSIVVPDGSVKVSERTVWYESCRTPQRMPPELLATTPPTVAKSVDAGSGPTRRACLTSSRLTCPSTVPDPARARCALVLEPDAREVAADVDHDPVALALPVQRRAAGAQRHRDPLAAAVVEHARDVAGVVRHHDRLRDQPVRRGVARVADEVQRAREHAVGTEQRLEVTAQPGRCPVRQYGVEPVGDRHQNRCIPGATLTSTSCGVSAAIASPSLTRSSSSSSTRCDSTP